MTRSIHPIAALLVAACALSGTVNAADGDDASAGRNVAATPWDGALNAPCGPARLSLLQRRVLQKSEQGADALRRYVFITRGMHQLDLVETATWARQYRSRQAACAAPSIQAG